MAVSRHKTFLRNEILPSWWANAVQVPLSVLAENFHIRRLNATTVRVIGGSGKDVAVVAVDGLWRWAETNVDAAHPGGAAGLYRVFATAKANNITNSPAPNTDNTDYSFALSIKADGQTPAIVPGTVDRFVEVAVLQWDGVQITSIAQSRESVSGAQLEDDAVTVATPLTATRQPGGQILLAAPVDAVAATPALRTLGSGAQQAMTGRPTTILFGTAGDTNLYRSAADVLKSDDSLVAALDIRARDAATTQMQMGSVSGSAGLYFGSAGDANLYRSAAATLRTDGALSIGASLTVGGNAALSAAGAFIQRNAGSSGAQVLAFRAATDAADRLAVFANGQLSWGDGAAATDTTLFRNGVTDLRTNGQFASGLELVSRIGSATRVFIGDVASVLGTSNPGVGFGPGADLALYRSASGILATNGALAVGNGVGFYGVAPTTQRTGYGLGVQVGTYSTLTASSTLNDVIAAVSRLIAGLRTYGLIGA